MVFSHIDKLNCENKKPNDKKTTIENFIDAIHDKKKLVFILFYMVECGPCNATRPEWSKLKNIFKKYKKSDNIIIADIENTVAMKYSKEFKPIEVPNGFPTIIFVADAGKTVEHFGNNTERNIDEFAKWINEKIDSNTNKNKITGGTRKHNRGGKKWSSKYKKSINCKNPKGFSQKQYCKYGR